MKRVRITSGRHHYRDIEVPETRAEAHQMLIDAMSAQFDVNGGDAHRNSVSGRVAFGLIGERLMAPNPTIALNFLLQKLCEVEETDD